MIADTTPVSASVHWVAIDIARRYNVVLVETAAGLRHRFKMTNTAQDFDRLIAFLVALGGKINVALEPTGDYHRALAHRLLCAGFHVSSVSTVALRCPQNQQREELESSG